MNDRHVRLIDRDQTTVAEAQVRNEGDHFGGIVDLHATPASIRRLFDEFEEVINEQMFALLDEIQGRIQALGIKAVFDDGWAMFVADLQVYPGSNELSFRLPDLPPTVVKPVLPASQTQSVLFDQSLQD